jgi:hypothetical protein
MNSPGKVEQFQAVLSELRALLLAEGDYQEFAFLLQRCSELAGSAATDPEAAEALKDYLSYQPHVPGSLRDLVIWRDSCEERKAINDKLDFLREKLISLARSL